MDGSAALDRGSGAVGTTVSALLFDTFLDTAGPPGGETVAVGVIVSALGFAESFGGTGPLGNGGAAVGVAAPVRVFF